MSVLVEDLLFVGEVGNLTEERDVAFHIGNSV